MSLIDSLTPLEKLILTTLYEDGPITEDELNERLKEKGVIFTEETEFVN